MTRARGAMDVPSLPGTLTGRMRLLPQLQVLDSVVVTDTVAMMDSLAGEQTAPKVLSHHKPVFHDAPSPLGHREKGAVVGEQDAHIALDVALLSVPVDGTVGPAPCPSVAEIHAGFVEDPVDCLRIGTEVDGELVSRAIVAGVAPDDFDGILGRCASLPPRRPCSGARPFANADPGSLQLSPDDGSPHPERGGDGCQIFAVGLSSDRFLSLCV